MPDISIALPVDPGNLLFQVVLLAAGFICAIAVLEVFLFVGCSILMTLREGKIGRNP